MEVGEMAVAVVPREVGQMAAAVVAVLREEVPLVAAAAAASFPRAFLGHHQREVELMVTKNPPPFLDLLSPRAAPVCQVSGAQNRFRQ
jgi:hypothetical protein